MATAGKTVVRTVRVGEIRYQLERTRCGKSNCRRCREGPAHGPYWYSYQRRDGRSVRSYHGRTAPRQVVQALRLAEAEEKSRRSLEHDAIIDMIFALEDLGALLWDADEEDDHDPEDLSHEDLERLRTLADELEEQAKEFANATRLLRRHVRQCITHLNSLADGAEEYLDDDDGQNTPELYIDESDRGCDA